MSEGPPTCPHCSAPLAPTAAQGALCPRCLLAQGMARSDSRLDSDGEPKPPPPLPPEVAELAPLFPELEILELLGQGGMGAVYKARQRALGRLVALKILTPRSGDEAGFAARFEREAHALARLAHPNVVGIHDSGRTQGRCWLLMEYVEGVNLRQLLRAGELDVPRALAIVRQICDALEFAHEQGIVHRDIKPENVLVDRKGRVKIADFGLAKIVGEEPSGEPITRTQQSMGTPQYMAPEQLTGSKSVDHRADIYSLGVVFYELLTGELPLGRFEAPSQRVKIDVRLDEVVLRALERAPERRYQHATEMKTGIDGLDTPVPKPAAVPSLAWLMLFVPAELILKLVPSALGLGSERASELLLAFNLLLFVVLGVCAWAFRGDRRGAALRYAIGLCVLFGALACLVRERSVFGSLFGMMSATQTSFDVWVARGLLVLVAFEGFRLARSGRAALAAVGGGSDLRAILGALSVVLIAMFENTWPYTAVLLAFVVLCTDPSALPAEEPPAKAERPPRPLRTLFGRILLPLLVAISAWVMPLYTRSWGWFGVIASSLVLALAVAGYLQESLPGELREELRKASPWSRGARALAAFVLLSIGALSMGASFLGTSSAAQRDAEPTNEHVVELAALVAANSQEDIDPMRALPERIKNCRLDSRTQAADSSQARESEPSGGDGLALILIAPLLIVWTRRWGSSWLGCLRYSAEVLAIVLLGYLGSLPVGSVLLARSHAPRLRPLVVQASLPQGLEKTRDALERALRAEGYSVRAASAHMLGDGDGWALGLETFSARADPVLGRFATWPSPLPPAGTPLAIELAGDPGQWYSAIRIDAGEVSESVHAERQAQLTRIIRATHGD